MEEPNRLATPHGTSVGRYRLERRLGRGGMGEVWLGRDVVSGSAAAVKLVSPEASESARRQFEREWRAIAHLDHPNIVHLYEVGETHLAMAFIDGPSLQRRMQTPIAPAQAVTWVLQVASALAHAHDHGVVHRDVKPGNVLLDAKGNAHLADFGLALFAEDVRVERAGTPKYMAPEQWQQSRVTAHVDQYALGRTLLALLIGGPPPQEPGTAFAMLPPELPSALVEVLTRSMRRDPSERFPTMAAFAAALAAVELEGLSAHARLAAPKRDSEPYRWMTAGHRQAEVGHDIERVDFRLSELAGSGALSPAAWQQFVDETGYGEVGWAMFGRRSRLGPLDQADAMSRASEIVVLLHGWGCTREVWARVARQLCLSNAELLVLVPDIQGFGESRFAGRWPALRHTAPDALYAMVLRWLALLSLTELPTVVVGHSMSGIAVLAGRDGSDLRRPYRVSIAPAWVASRPAAWLVAKLASLLAYLLVYLGPLFDLVVCDDLGRGPAGRRIAPRVRAGLVANMRAAERTALVRVLAGVALGQDVSADAVHRTVILAGVQDPMLDPARLRIAADRAGIPASNVRLVSTASHFPHIEESDHPESTARSTAEIVACIEDMLISCRDPTVSASRDTPSTLPAVDASDGDTGETLADLFDDA